MYVCMYIYVHGQIAQVVEHQTADPWVTGSSPPLARSARTVNDS